MGKATKRARMARGKARGLRDLGLDATPERLAKGDASEFVNPAIIDSSEQPIGRARRFFRESRLDRWHKAGVITQRQYTAGDEYRTLHMRAVSVPRVVASYGERTSAGETDYGLARTAAQARARSRWRAARDNVPPRLLGVLERLLIHDALPRYRGRAQMQVITDARQGLDALAHHFERA